jgi:hypothetical protein
MYASVEMLLKFCAENFSFECTGENIREKSAHAHTPSFCKVEISHWHPRYFTRVASADRIHLALVDFSNKIFPFFSRMHSALVGMSDETEKNDPMR